MLGLWSFAAQGQTGGAPLSAPALPSTLPGGGAVPGLPASTQQEILQRLLDAGAGRPLGGGALQAGPAQPLPVAPAPPVAPPGAGLAGPTPAAASRAGTPEEDLSPIERFFRNRAATAPDNPGSDASDRGPLRQFGYDMLRSEPSRSGTGSAFGAVPENYVVGLGDRLRIVFRGRARLDLTQEITRDGFLMLPEIMPVPAAGRTLRELRDELSLRAERQFGNSEVFVSIEEPRRFTLFVGGEVTRPGMVELPFFANVLDALVAAGGLRKTGTMRAIRLEGPRGARFVDLYPAIAGEGGPAPDLSIREGERIVVGPIGGVVAIGGEVARPAIYELPRGAAQVPLSQVLALAGDALRPAGNRFLLETTDGEGRRAFREIGLSGAIRRGDALIVQPGSDVQAGQVRLSGHVQQVTTRAVGGRAGSLRGLLADPRLVRPDPYARMAVIWRLDGRTRGRRFQPFDLGALLTGRGDLALAEGDDVIILSAADIAFLATPSVQAALRGEAPNAPPAPALTVALPQPRTPATPVAPVALGDCPALTQLAIAARSSPQRFAHARVAGFPEIGALPCPQVFLDYPALLTFLLDQAVLLTGEARAPGLYPILNDTGLDAVLAVAGGVTDTADLSSVELAREPVEQAAAIPLSRTLLDLRSRNFAAVRLSPRDGVRIPRGFGDRDSGPVTLVGEFVRPGTYDIRRGERLSEVIARAGGLTAQAFPYGAVFTRESVRQRQQEGFQRTARELEQGMLQVAAATAMINRSSGGGSDIGAALAVGRELAGALREARAAGRMVVEANPVVLAGRPDLDVLLEPGDLIVMPKRPNEVTVVGAVQNPGSLQFATGWRASQYVQAAGGVQRFADPSRAFLVLPNGTSVPAGLGAWQQGGPPVPPGSLVVVPNDPSPYERWGFLRDMTQLASQIALSGAALAVISRGGR